MFSPNDVGLPYPLTYKMYHGRYVICDSMGHELFLLEVIRPSLEAKRWIEEWAKAICEKFNNQKIVHVPTSIDKKEEIAVEEKRQIELPVKRGRGRPRKK